MWSGTKSAIGRAALWMVGSASYVHEIAERQREVAALSRAAAKDLAGSGLSGSNDQNLWLRHEVAQYEWTRGLEG